MDAFIPGSSRRDRGSNKGRWIFNATPVVQQEVGQYVTGRAASSYPVSFLQLRLLKILQEVAIIVQMLSTDPAQQPGILGVVN